MPDCMQEMAKWQVEQANGYVPYNAAHVVLPCSKLAVICYQLCCCVTKCCMLQPCISPSVTANIA